MEKEFNPQKKVAVCTAISVKRDGVGLNSSIIINDFYIKVNTKLKFFKKSWGGSVKYWTTFDKKDGEKGLFYLLEIFCPLKPKRARQAYPL